MMLRVFILIFACLLWIPVIATAAAPPESLLLTIQNKAAETRSVSSPFIQEKHLSLFNEVVISEGFFAFATPDSLRWEYQSPFRSGFIMHGPDGLEWDEASGTERKFTEMNSPHMAMVSKQIMAWTAFDLQWLKSQYQLDLIQPEHVVLKLTPHSKDAREFLTHLLVTFTQDLTSIQAIELHESDGDFTRIKFTSPVINGAMPPSLFTSIKQ